ncbi:hypothetical protein D3C86_2087350 [compost metagenome]|jgi:hypothetical protein
MAHLYGVIGIIAADTIDPPYGEQVARAFNGQENGFWSGDDGGGHVDFLSSFLGAILVPRFRGDFQFKMTLPAKLAFCGPLL